MRCSEPLRRVTPATACRLAAPTQPPFRSRCVAPPRSLSFSRNCLDTRLPAPQELVHLVQLAEQAGWASRRPSESTTAMNRLLVTGVRFCTKRQNGYFLSYALIILSKSALFSSLINILEGSALNHSIAFLIPVLKGVTALNSGTNCLIFELSNIAL